MFASQSSAPPAAATPPLRCESGRAPVSVQSMLNAFTTPHAVLSASGVLLHVNAAWAAARSGHGRDIDCREGESYGRWCEALAGDAALAKGVARVLSGAVKSFRGVCRTVSDDVDELHVSLRRLDGETPRSFLLSHDWVEPRPRDDMRDVEDRVLKVQIEERERLAADLHDSVGQTLLSLSLGLARLRRLIGQDARFTPVVDDMSESLRQAQSQIRTVSFLLQPPWLDEHGGFPRAIRDLVCGFGRRAGIQASLEFGHVPPLSEGAELTLFRIAQEALVNVHKHARADAVKVQLSSARACVVLKVQDNGRGMAAPEGAGAGPGVGILGMRARLRKYGGDLRIVSGPTGTTVVAKLPV